MRVAQRLFGYIHFRLAAFSFVQRANYTRCSCPCSCCSRFNVGEFVEVHVSTSLQTCEERDTKGLYKKVSCTRNGAVRIELHNSLQKFEQYCIACSVSARA